MPIVVKPMKIKHMPDAEIDLSGITDPDWLGEMLAEYGTGCEFPSCSQPATTTFFYERVVAWVCASHREICLGDLVRYDSMLAVHIYGQFLVWSYVMTDINSGLSISDRSARCKKESKKANKALSAQDTSVTEIRQIMARIGSKPGQPEES